MELIEWIKNEPYTVERTSIITKATELLEKEREVIIGVAHYAFADALRPVSEQCSSFEDFYTKTFTDESK